jgi:hypothetical protein
MKAQPQEEAQMTANEMSRTPVRDGFVADRPPLPLASAAAALWRCALRTAALLRRHEVAHPKDRIGQVLRFADGSGGRVYRETAVRNASIDSPALLIVGFKLRWIRGRGHAVFRAESALNTPLFVGFPGFRSKLWLAHDTNGVYRGFYQWDDARLADAYARALWWVLALVSERGSIRYVVIPGLRRDDVLEDPSVIEGPARVPGRPWWLLTGIDRTPSGNAESDRRPKEASR